MVVGGRRVSITPKTGTESGRETAKEQKIGRHPAGPGRADVLRIEPAGAVSTLGALIADEGKGVSDFLANPPNDSGGPRTSQRFESDPSSRITSTRVLG